MKRDDYSSVLASNAPANDLERNVYCVLGLPIDALDMPAILRRIDAAATSRAPFLISTPNLNFLVNSRSDPEFRDSVLASDLCPADGMPIVWIARLIGAPIRRRASGSDIFEALKSLDRDRNHVKLFLFGGAEGVAMAAAQTLNSTPSGVSCVGALNPGLGTVEEMSREDIVDKINASGADFLLASLGARKGQLWLLRNHRRLTIPIRAHLGATINFQAGTVKRAPPWLRASGFEWLWRIKEEPHLWRRYAGDFLTLLRLTVTRVVPLVFINRIIGFKSSRKFSVSAVDHGNDIIINLNGRATAENVHEVISNFQKLVSGTAKRVTLDLSHCHFVDARFFGLFLMLRKTLKTEGRELRFTGVSPPLRRLFGLNEVGFLLSPA